MVGDQIGVAWGGFWKKQVRRVVVYTSHDLISCGGDKVYKKQPPLDQQSTVVIWLLMEQHITLELSILLGLQAKFFI